MPAFFDTAADTPPLIAILRGLLPEQAAAVGETLYAAGFRVLEVPLNRPQALRSIELLARTLPAGAVVGGGTVLSAVEVEAVAAAGGTLVVSPDANAEVIRATRERGLWSLPGAATPTEAFAAIRAGAHAIKAFPAEALPPAVIHHPAGACRLPLQQCRRRRLRTRQRLVCLGRTAAAAGAARQLLRRGLERDPMLKQPRAGRRRLRRLAVRARLAGTPEAGSP